MIKQEALFHHFFQFLFLNVALVINAYSDTIFTEEMLIKNASLTPQKLHIYNWADYINPDALLNFEREFGIDITYDTYDSSEMVDTKLLTGKLSLIHI